MFDLENALEALGRISAELVREQKAETALIRITETVRELIGCSDTGIWVMDTGSQELVLRVTNTAASQVPQIRLAYGQGMVGGVAEKRRPRVIAEAQWEAEDDPLAKAGFHSAIGVPLLWQGDLYGVLVAMDDMPGRTFAARDVRVVDMMALQAAAVLANERLMAQNRQLQQELVTEQEQLLHIHVAIRQMLETTDIHANLVEITEAFQALGWRRVILGLFSEEMAVDQLVTAGVSAEDEQRLREHIVPEEIWARFLADELEDHRIDGLYYIQSGDASSDVWNEGDLLFAPLRLGQEQVVGVIRVEAPVNEMHPTAERLRPVDILVGQAAYIVENARLLEATSESAAELAEQVEELSMVHRADRELTSHLDLDRVMALTIDWALRRARAETGLLALMTDDRRGLVPLINLAYLAEDEFKATEQKPWALDRGIMGRAASTGETQVLHGEEAEADYVRIMPGTRAKIAVPLSMRGEVLGVIVLASTNEEVFHKPDVNFLERLSRRAAVALDNARLFRQSEQLADDMAVLYSASRAITATLERDVVLQRIAQSMAVALECSSTVIFNYQADTQQAQVLTVYQVGTVRDAEELLPEAGDVVPLDEIPGMVRAVKRRRARVMRVSDPEVPASERQKMAADGIHAAIIVPLVAQDELLGIATVIEGRHDRVFTTNEVFKAETLASQASVALRLSMLYEEVLELERLKSDMIRMASHDLRNPLNNIMGYVELLEIGLNQYGAPSEQASYLHNLQRSAQIMQTLIHDLLTLERVESERESEWQAFDLGGLVVEVVEEERANAELKRQTLILDRGSDLLPMFGSVTQLRQAVANLVGNAIKYTPEEGRISVYCDSANDRLNVRVVDNGYGISPERQGRIFQRFYRAREPSTDHIPGTGLGLSLVKTVIERHGGEVWFESTLGVGSTFGFRLPVAVKELP